MKKMTLSMGCVLVVLSILIFIFGEQTGYIHNLTKPEVYKRFERDCKEIEKINNVKGELRAIQYNWDSEYGGEFEPKIKDLIRYLHRMSVKIEESTWTLEATDTFQNYLTQKKKNSKILLLLGACLFTGAVFIIVSITRLSDAKKASKSFISCSK